MSQASVLSSCGTSEEPGSLPNGSGENTQPPAPGSTACAGEKALSLKRWADYPRVYERFVSNGGNPADIITLRSSADVLNNFSPMLPPRQFSFKSESAVNGRNFSVSTDCQLNVSSFLLKDRRTPSKNIHHHLLAKGNEVLTAGVIFFYHTGNRIRKVVLANRSNRYCPSPESLEIARKILIEEGVESDRIVILNNVNEKCQITAP